jgi:hypothetical protein
VFPASIIKFAMVFYQPLKIQIHFFKNCLQLSKKYCYICNRFGKGVPPKR